MASAHWKRELERRDASSLLELRDQVADLETHPAWIAINELLAQGRDGVIKAITLPGPPVSGKAANKQLGYLAGLAELEVVTTAIREVVDGREKQLQAEAERQAAEEEPPS